METLEFKLIVPNSFKLMQILATDAWVIATHIICECKKPFRVVRMQHTTNTKA
jgi:hypothetical protein